MKKLILLLSLMAFYFSAHAESQCYSICKEWDIFCKSLKQIVATKCHLGMLVKHEQCKKPNISNNYLVRGGGSFVERLSCDYYSKKEKEI